MRRGSSVLIARQSRADPRSPSSLRRPLRQPSPSSLNRPLRHLPLIRLRITELRTRQTAKMRRPRLHLCLPSRRRSSMIRLRSVRSRTSRTPTCTHAVPNGITMYVAKMPKNSSTLILGHPCAMSLCFPSTLTSSLCPSSPSTLLFIQAATTSLRTQTIIWRGSRQTKTF